MKSRLVTFLIMMYVSSLIVAQNDIRQEFKQLVDESDTYSDIIQTFHNYIDTIDDSYEKFRFEKHFSRWANYQSLHLGPDKNFTNIPQRTYRAVQEKDDNPTRSTNASWTFVGPNSTTTNNPSADLNGNGRVDRIAFHPSDPDILYVGTPAGGLWKTTDGGSNWDPISSFIPSLGISGIVVDHTDPDILYVLTGTGDSYVDNYFVNVSGYIRKSVGVLVSYNGGVDWQQTGQLSANEFYGHSLKQHPTDSDILIAATSDGLYRTTDGGDTWVLEQAGNHYDIEFKPGSPSTVYATGEGAFYYSNDTGDTWNNDASFNFNLCAGNRVEIAVTPASANRVYLLASPYLGANSFCGIFRSINSGLNFTRLTNTPNILSSELSTTGDQSQYDLGIAVNPNDQDTVVACGLIVWRSNNGGSIWNNATTYRESGGNYIHPDVHAVEYNPLDGKLYACSDGGAHVSSDNGDSWTDIYTGINTTQFWHIDDFDGAANVVLGGAQDNGVKYKSTDTTDFSHIRCCDGGDMIIDYSNQNAGFAAVNQKIFRYTNFTGASPTEELEGGFFMQMDMHSSNTNILYVSSNRVYSFVVSTGALTQLGSNDIHGHWVTRTCPSNSNRIYTAGGTNAFAVDGKMFRTDDSGATWDTISNGNGFPANYSRISDIGVRPNSSGTVYACISGYDDGVKVYYSTNAGSDWTNISYDLPNVPVWSIEVDGSNNVYLGTDIGVYYKSAGATAWEPFYNGLPNVPVSDLALNSDSDQLLASTFGRGIWKTSTHTSCPVAILISNDVSGRYFRTASSSITMTGEVKGGEGSNVILRSNGYVDLEPGFKIDAEPGNKFLAYMGECEEGLPPSYGPNQSSPYHYELIDYKTSFTRAKGTIELLDNRTLRIRNFAKGSASILIFNNDNILVDEINDIDPKKDILDIDIDYNNMVKGNYTAYLIIDNEVTHLQELNIR